MPQRALVSQPRRGAGNDRVMEDRLQSRSAAQLSRPSHTGRIRGEERDRGINSKPTVLPRTAIIRGMKNGSRSAAMVTRMPMRLGWRPFYSERARLTADNVRILGYRGIKPRR